MADGHLIFDTKIDESGFNKAADKIEKEADKTSENVVSEASETSQKIQAILDDTTRSMKSKAASIAAVYKAQGMDMSQAMSLAWSHIERGSAEVDEDMVSHSEKSQKKIRSQFDKTGSYAYKSFDSMSDRLKGTFSKLGKALAAAFSTYALVNFSKSAIQTASDMQEVQNVVDTAFGEMSGQMETFAESAIETYGIAKLTAKRTGSTFMAMATGMDVNKDKASEMSLALTGLSADMASFYNVEQEVASTALKSVFTGETETLKQFGIVMTEANLKAYALSQGITKSYQEMTQAEKVQLRYGYVMQQTALAQGDFARTSEGWANQTRMLTEKWKEFGAIIGELMMTVLLPVVRTLNNALSELIGWAQSAVASLKEAFGIDTEVKAVEKMADATEQVADNYAAGAEAAQEASEANDSSLASFDKVTKLGDTKGSQGASDAGFNTTPVSGAVTSTTKQASKLGSIFEGLKDKFQPIIDALGRLKDSTAPFAENVGEGLMWLWENALKPLGNWAIESFIPAAIDAIGAAIEAISAIWDKAEPTLMRWWEEWLGPLAKWAGDTIVSALEGLGDAFSYIADNITEKDVEVLLELGGAIAGIYAATKSAKLIKDFGSALSGLKTTASNAFSMLSAPVGSAGVQAGASFGVQAMAAVGAAIAGWQIGSEIYDAFEEEINGFLWPIFDACVAAWDAVCNFFTETIPTFFADMGTAVMDAFDAIDKWFYDLFVSCVEGIKNAFSAIGKWFSDRWQDIKDAFSAAGQWFSDLFVGAWEGIKDAFSSVKSWFSDRWEDIKSVFAAVGDWFSDIFSGAWEGVKTAFSGVASFFEDIKETILGVWDAIKEGIKSAINWVIDGINEHLIDNINKIGFDLPDVLGGGHVGFDLPRIPRLATGMVVPANYGEFAAILGDNKREPEIVSPLSTMKQALLEALRESRGTSSKQPTVFKLYLDTRRGTRLLSEQIIDDVNDIIDSTGTVPFNI